MFHQVLRKATLAATLVLGMAGVAQAATVTFAAGSFVDQDGTPRSIFDVVISDIVGGVNVAVSQASALANGDVLLLGLEGFNLTGATFDINPDPNTSDVITAVCTTGLVSGCDATTGNNTGGGDFTGGAFQPGKAATKNKPAEPGGAFFEEYGYFDTIIRIGRQGSDSGLNNGFNIDITGTQATASSFTVVGIRAQTTSGVGGENSLKIYNDTPSTVPLPAGLPLLLAGLGALALVRRRKA